MSAISQAMRDICDEKGIPFESVLETVEAALAAAYRKDFGEKNQNIKVTFDPETAGVSAFDEKEVVEDEFVAEALREIEERQKQRDLEEQMRAEGKLPPAPEVAVETRRQPEELEIVEEDGVKKYNPKLHIALAEARGHESDTQVGGTIRIPLEVPGAFGRMAAQTAKQVIMQRLREAERDTIYNEWKSAEGEVVTATVQRREGRTVLLDLGPRTTGILREEEQIPTDRYAPGTRVKVLLYAVGKTMRGPELLCSRTHPDLIRHLFMVEVPEVSSGAVQIMAVAREPGSRAKVAVRATEEHVDPIGACIGQRGTRVQTIIAELSGEKIDIIEYAEQPAAFLANAMSPAKVVAVELHEPSKTAVVRVPADQFSLAIGRSGQNVRLAARLTGWKINVQEAVAPAVQEGEVVDAVSDAEPATVPPEAPTALEASEAPEVPPADDGTAPTPA
ncbi:MAG: transcription termination factor NusA [bacterium]|nr:transcription termination factor NusA [bacterium]